MPEGGNFEIYRQESLEKSHRDGNDEDRSEYCSAYARRNPEQFGIELIEPPKNWKRTDLRLTVDYPEDLILCRNIYMALKEYAPQIPFEKIINYVDQNKDIRSLVEPYVDITPIWASIIG